MIISRIAMIIGTSFTGLMILFHISFPKRFSWKKDLEEVSALNKKILFSIHLALILVFVIFFCISLFHFEDLVNPQGLATSYLILISLFWFWRTIWQIIYFWPPKSKRFPLMHIILTSLFLILSLSHIVPVIL